MPNCIYLLNKYHAEYKRHGNKALALTRMVRKVGNATFMTNATTALGFAAFISTTSDVLQQFGVIASVNILAMFCISLRSSPPCSVGSRLRAGATCATSTGAGSTSWCTASSGWSATTAARCTS